MRKLVPNIVRVVAFAVICTFGLLSGGAFAQNLQPQNLQIQNLQASPVQQQTMHFAAADDCLSARAAQQAAVNGRIMQKEQVYAQNGWSPADVTSLKVCRRQGELYYVLTVRQGSNADRVWVNARTGLS